MSAKNDAFKFSHFGAIAKTVKLNKFDLNMKVKNRHMKVKNTDNLVENWKPRGKLLLSTYVSLPKWHVLVQSFVPGDFS